jgi:hypothetical protein
MLQRLLFWFVAATNPVTAWEALLATYVGGSKGLTVLLWC